MWYNLDGITNFRFTFGAGMKGESAAQIDQAPSRMIVCSGIWGCKLSRLNRS